MARARTVSAVSAGASGVVVLDAVTGEDLHPPVVHAHGNAEVVFAQGPAQQGAGSRIQVDERGHAVELGLGRGIRVVAFAGGHRGTSAAGVAAGRRPYLAGTGKKRTEGAGVEQINNSFIYNRLRAS